MSERPSKKDVYHHINIIPQQKLFSSLLNIVSRRVKKSDKLRVLDLGCGKRRWKKPIETSLSEKSNDIDYIGLDLYFSEADIQLDLNKEKLPFDDDSVDIVVCKEVLEHLYNPFFVLREIERVVKDGGLILITTPFLFPVHEKRHDYFRYTFNFYRNYYAKHRIEEEAISNTFLSLFLYVMQQQIVGHTGLRTVKRISSSVVAVLQKPFDWLALAILRRREITYSYYVDVGL